MTTAGLAWVPQALAQEERTQPLLSSPCRVDGQCVGKERGE